MNRFARVIRRIANALRPARANADLGDELRFHLDMEAEALERQGVAHGVARVEAQRRFGGVDRYAEECRDERGGRRLEAMGQDARYAARMARRFPGFTAIIILTLAFAIGANTAIFTVVNAVLLRPPPFPNPDQVVALYAQNPDRSLPRFSISWADFEDWRRMTTSFAGMAAFGGTTMTLASDQEPERIPGLTVTSNFLDVLGIHPSLGRGFAAEDEKGEASQAVILTDGFWRRRFGADAAIIGRVLQFSGGPRTVIGVMPAEFDAFAGRTVDAIVVLTPTGIPNVASHAQHLLQGMARLKPGVTLAHAQQDLAAVAARVAEQNADIAGWSANVFGWQDELVRNTRRPLLTLLAAAGFVLLIGCINVANLLVTRAAARGREIALRQALGASRKRLVAQLLVETIGLALVGGALGVAMAAGGTRGILKLVPPGTIIGLDTIRVNLPVLAFALGLTLFTAVLVGLWPAMRATGARLSGVLSAGGRGAAGTHSPRVRRALVVAEVSLALVLLVCSALVIQSLRNILNVDPGFRVDHITTMQVTLSGVAYRDSAPIRFYRDVLGKLSARPGIEAAAAANTPPIAGGGIVAPIRLMGKGTAPSQQLMGAATAVTPGFFNTMGIRMLQGRDVSWDDPVPTLVLSETAAKTYWPGENVIGKRIAFGRADNLGLEIVGLVADSRARGLTVDPVPMIYMSFRGATNVARTMTLVVRSPGDAASVVATTKSVLQDVDRTLPIFNVRSVGDIVAQFLAQPRLNTTLLGIFAVMALLLAGLGIYGVVSHSVSQRTQELGVRVALGAQRSDLVRMVLGEGAVLAVIGVVIGLAGALAATPLIQSWLFGIGTNDPLTMALVALVLVGIALAASYVPARRATRVDPVLAMRGE